MGRRRIDHETEMVLSPAGGRFIIESRASRVARIRSLVKTGRYHIDPMELAETLLSRIGGDGDARQRPGDL